MIWCSEKNPTRYLCASHAFMSNSNKKSWKWVYLQSLMKYILGYMLMMLNAPSTNEIQSQFLVWPLCSSVAFIFSWCIRLVLILLVFYVVHCKHSKCTKVYVVPILVLLILWDTPIWLLSSLEFELNFSKAEPSRAESVPSWVEPIWGISIFELKFPKLTNFWSLLTLIGMRGDTFISLSYLDQIFSADFLSKLSKLEVKIDINGVDLTPCQAHWDL